MVQVYRALLHLYPAEYRETFATEMIETFEQAIRQRGRGVARGVRFLAVELAGLLGGALSEWKAKRAAAGYYMRPSSFARRTDGMPHEIVAVEDDLEKVLRSMEFAIAHHDFVKARLYSNEERTTRALLDRLVSAYQVDRGVSKELQGTNGYA